MYYYEVMSYVKFYLKENSKTSEIISAQAWKVLK